MVAGALMLGLTGTGGLSGTDTPDVIAASTTDIVAHVLGFVMGAALGIVVAASVIRRWLSKVPQWATGFAAMAVVAGAWGFGLNS